MDGSAFENLVSNIIAKETDCAAAELEDMWGGGTPCTSSGCREAVGTCSGTGCGGVPFGFNLG
eukprot:7907388-Ditylum_brightwellii.AAC.1